MNYLFLLLISATSFANCNIFINNENVEYIGYSLNISDANYKLISDKNFNRVFDNSNKYTLSVEAYEVIGNKFNVAQSKLVIMQGENLHYELVVNKTCFTQSCSVSTVANSLNKLFVNARKKLGSCI